jgi:hypothetical protein
MLRKLKRMRRNPMLLAQYVLNNPKKVALMLLGVAGVVAVVLLSFQVDAIPTWIGLLGLAVLPGYAAWLQWGRLSLLIQASEMPADQVTPGVVKVSGTARAARGDLRVSPGREHDEEYLAYKRIEKVDTDHGNEDEELPFLDEDTRERDLGAVPLYVEDDTGDVLVDTNNADVRLSWDDTNRSGRRTTKWAALRPGDQVTVYGTAMPPEQRTPPGLVDSLSDLSDTMAGQDFGDIAAEEDTVISKGPQLPYLIVSDRSGIGLLGRQLVYFLAAALLTLGLFGAAGLGILGMPVV